MKKVLLIILVLCGSLGSFAQNNVYGKKVVGLDSVVTNHINARAGDVVTVLTALQVDGDVGIGQAPTTSPLAITESSTDNVSTILMTGTAARKTRIEIDNNGTSGDHYSLGVGVIGTGNGSFTIHNEDTNTDEFKLLDGDATFSGRVQTTTNSSGATEGAFNVDVASSEIAAISLDEDTRWWMWNGDGTLNNSLNFSRGTNYNSNNPTLTLQGNNATFAGDMTFSDYGSGSNTGTAAYSLAVDASGNVIEETYGSFGTEIKSTGTAPRLLLKETDGTADRNLQFLVNGSELGFENLNDAESSNTRLTTLDLGTGDWDFEGNKISNVEEININGHVQFDRSDLTISGGVITVTGSYHRVDTEGSAASDDLDTITAASESGQILVIRPSNSARTVVMKDGTGNLFLAGDFSMDNNTDTITLISDGSNWIETSRSDNGS